MARTFENVKGTYDYLPEKQIIREKIKATLQSVFVKYGFAPTETPIVCMYDLLASKYSEGADILNEMYKLTDQGKRQLGLRYDLTITFSKLISSNPDIVLPFKRYEIGRVYRDGPVKVGRNREFTQCDVDVVGVKSMMAEAEYMLMTVEAYQKLGLEIEIAFNNRKLLTGIIKHVCGEISEDKMRRAIMLIDKFAKMSKQELLKEFQLIQITVEQFEKMVQYFSMDYLTLKESFSDSSNVMIQEGLNELAELYHFLEGTEALKYMKFAPYLARGIDIYTGTVWEIFMKDRKVGSQDFNLSIGGGGRYDKIITTFVNDGNEYPAVGMSFGLDVIYEILLLKEEGKRIPTVDLYVVPFGTFRDSFQFVSKLREAGLKVEIEKEEKKLKKSLSYANKMNIPFVIVLGEDELTTGKLMVKEMETGENHEFDVKDIQGIVDFIENKLDK